MMSKLYTLEITVLRAAQVPVADINNFTSDPYVTATLSLPDYPASTGEDPLTFRTPTVHGTLHPNFNARWLVSGVPLPLPSQKGGIHLEFELDDEDPGSKHEKLGSAEWTLGSADIQLKGGEKSTAHTAVSESTQGITVDTNGTRDQGHPNESAKDPMAQPPADGDVLWDSGERELKVQKRKGNLKTHVATYLASALTRGKVSHHARLWARVRVLGEAADQEDKRVYTLGPYTWRQHLSPILGHVISGGTAHNDDATETEASDAQAKSASTFIASRIQLAGPAPAVLHHRYVGYRPFIKKMFNSRGVEGMVLHRALHKQYMTVYAYGRGTTNGVVGVDEPRVDKKRETEADEEAGDRDGAESDAAHPDGAANNQKTKVNKDEQSPSNAQTHHPHPTSTLTSPHSLSDGRPLPELVARRFLAMTAHGTYGRLFTYVILRDGEWRFTETGSEFTVDLLSKHSMHADMALEIAFSGEFFVRRIGDDGEGEEGEAGDDPKDYELVIDNDSGTYRPRKELLPDFQAWLTRPNANLSALGRVTVMDGFDPALEAMKEKRQEVKRRAKGLPPKSRKQEKEEKKKAREEEAGEEGDSKPGSASGEEKKSDGGVEVKDGPEEGKEDPNSKSEQSETPADKAAMIEKEDAQRAEANEDTDGEAKAEIGETGVTKADAAKY